VAIIFVKKKSSWHRVVVLRSEVSSIFPIGSLALISHDSRISFSSFLRTDSFFDPKKELHISSQCNMRQRSTPHAFSGDKPEQARAKVKKKSRSREDCPHSCTCPSNISPKRNHRNQPNTEPRTLANGCDCRPLMILLSRSSLRILEIVRKCHHGGDRSPT